MHPYVALAKKAIEEYISNRKVLCAGSDIPEEMRRRSGVFVCLKVRGNLRGCIGTFQPCCKNLYDEIVRNAISASSEDPRFSMVRPDELDQIDYTVDVLSEPEKSTVSELDPKKYGIIVAKGSRRGLLLPDLEGVDTVDEQLRITKMKAGIMPEDKDVEIFRFTVDRYT
ncbi:MAG TPA: AmmeMemoRadiSam system protein A [Dissulfurispiraceae bacterium]|nr:AmmeMemoRadiSam system protein A [Dissulfurispiraceae bacterium]